MPLPQMKRLKLCREGIPRSQLYPAFSVPLHTPVSLEEGSPSCWTGALYRCALPLGFQCLARPRAFFPLPLLPTSKMAAGGADQVRGPGRASVVPRWTL